MKCVELVCDMRVYIAWVMFRIRRHSCSNSLISSWSNSILCAIIAIYGLEILVYVSAAFFEAVVRNTVAICVQISWIPVVILWMSNFFLYFIVWRVLEYLHVGLRSFVYLHDDVALRLLTQIYFEPASVKSSLHFLWVHTQFAFSLL